MSPLALVGYDIVGYLPSHIQRARGKIVNTNKLYIIRNAWASRRSQFAKPGCTEYFLFTLVYPVLSEDRHFLISL